MMIVNIGAAEKSEASATRHRFPVVNHIVRCENPSRPRHVAAILPNDMHYYRARRNDSGSIQ